MFFYILRVVILIKVFYIILDLARFISLNLDALLGVEVKTLIIYATRYGATAGTAEEIAKMLRKEGFDVKIVNLKEEKIRVSQIMSL